MMTGSVATWKPQAWVWVVCLRCRCQFRRSEEGERGNPSICLECQGTAMGFPLSAFINLAEQLRRFTAPS